ncbi:hypothetical protein CMQ_3305 [Grosmannia clavigera kw1407]|uniref:DUF8004 domain-containing protein n=1 Tax=Grosmannia clavigera (strain kw1407 / UAMH 11150) TaxID=655863 RepID=F0X9F7_GROCL|nr:uncharacterized protein CMQ_3305 [Grosmannia clavigera kw1407]EFX05236.1 hypothetical protein CMQ_3305 [Grosmannia clavigera kw1407]
MASPSEYEQLTRDVSGILLLPLPPKAVQHPAMPAPTSAPPPPPLTHSSPTLPPGYEYDDLSVSDLVGSLSLSSAPQLPPLDYYSSPEQQQEQEQEEPGEFDEQDEQEEQKPEERQAVPKFPEDYLPSPTRSAPAPPLPFEPILIGPPGPQKRHQLHQLCRRHRRHLLSRQRARQCCVRLGAVRDMSGLSEEAARNKAPRFNAVSGPLHLFKSQARGRSPSEAEKPRGRSVSAQPPETGTQSGAQPHAGTPPSSKGPPPPPPAEAWVLTADSTAEYNVEYLLSRERVPELWDEGGTLFIFLAPRDSGKEASFRVRASIISESPVLIGMALAETMSPVSIRSPARSFSGRDSLSAADAHRIVSPGSPADSDMGDAMALYLPVVSSNPGERTSELEQLLPVRNLFALLTGQPLVATHSTPTAFSVLLQVAALLREFEFGVGSSAGNGSFGSSGSFGEAVDLCLGFYLEREGLMDVRHSREKTLEALVLGEQLRFWPLYNEAFCHAVGKYPAMRETLRTSPLWQQLSGNTRLRLERAHLDLLSRQHSVNMRIEQFDFPSLFSGTGNSTSNDAYRGLRFKNWRTSFADMRSFVLRHYKSRFGSWPPKASSRRNPFSESGLNRLVLRTLYTDLCAVYDLLVDRSSFTPRVSEDNAVATFAVPPDSGLAPAHHHQHPHLHHRHATSTASTATTATTATSSTSTSTAATPTSASLAAARLPEIENAMMALRQILAEFDESSPPVLPPIPYDTPLLPSMTAVLPTYGEMSARDQARFDRGIKEAQMQSVLRMSHNADADCPDSSTFLAAFEAFELREARRGKSGAELAEMRIGHWLFLYVVLQSMPILVVDAPGLNHTDGVEYFLCEPSQGRPPWVEDAGEVRKAWFQTAGGAGPLVELSADVLLYSVEATYHRSHCWLAAQKWLGDARTGKGFNSGAAGAEAGFVPEPPSRIEANDDADSDFHMPDLPRPYYLAGSMSVPDLPRFIDSGSPLEPQSATTTSYSASFAAPLDLPTPTSPQDRSGSPVMMSRTSTDPLPNIQLQVPRQRANYGELQERANLRHASIGWALEPVKISDVDMLPLQQPQQQEQLDPEPLQQFQQSQQLPQLQQPQQRGLMVPPQARRVASAGNLRVNTGSDSLVNTGSTFDDILGGMDKTEKKNKRKSFLPFM